MNGRFACARLALVSLALVGCTREQAWTFHNGADLDDVPPEELLVEVYDSPECGFGCAPPGERVYCEVLERGRRGPAPQDLAGGRSYCFMGTAIDGTGTAYAVGCAVAEVGADPIDVPLSRLEERRAITRRCQQGPMVMIDAGMDAGPRDAGPAPVDAAPPDAGPPDAGGLPYGTPITVTLRVDGPGRVRVLGNGIDRTVLDGFGLEINAYVGYSMRIDPTPDTGARLVGISGGCGTADPCDVVLDQPEAIVVTFLR